ncbi:LVIVD repeat-containing protein [Lutibacter oricola]|uniref:LVIVD repeat-containing protein n=1 Tax=Lutibacter oricola TaxID=762486 RepID=A0A1H3DUG6_9FLAO|nr:hypothetical protein [Lutibacter oricola]SDX70172.1 LVIVD repeat-containing protein [Lutibacter oricola]
MKKFITYFSIVAVVFFSCDNNDTSNGNVSSNDGQGGSLAVFALKGNYLYTVDYQNLNVFNIQNEKSPVKVNTISIGFDIETLFSFKEYLFIGSQRGMFIYDVSSPELPKKVSESNHFTACDPVVANDEYAYVTLHSNTNCGGMQNELLTYDIADVYNPELLNVRELDGPKGLSLYNNYLLVCDSDVKIFDVSDPTNSIYVTSIPVTYSFDIIVRENHVFIISEIGIYQYLLDNDNIEGYEKLSELIF